MKQYYKNSLFLMNRFNKALCVFMTCMLLVSLFSCKDKDHLYPDPYSGGKPPLGIKFLNKSPMPFHGLPGDEVTYQVTGLAGFEKSDITFYQHNIKAEISAITDSTITIIVPPHASTGGGAMVVKGQYFFGPTFNIDGKVIVDPTFEVVNGANNMIADVFEMPSTNLLMIGAFSDYENVAASYPVNGIVMTTKDGAPVPTFLSGDGAMGSLMSIIRMSDGKYIIGGAFSRFGVRKGILNITRLNTNGSLDSSIINVVNLHPDKPEEGVDTVPAFNGGVSGMVRRLFNYGDQIVAVGNFSSYGRYFYERSTKDAKVLDETKINQLVRMNEDGSMDSTFNFNLATGKGYQDANGSISDAVMQPDGKIIIVGGFNKFNGATANHILRVDTNGEMDNTFNVGTGADDVINSIRYNATTDKYMLTGKFKNFNGQPYNGIVMLDEDGSVDPSFKPRLIEGGSINFAGQLSNGLILVSGTFTSYDHVVRNGFMILNPDGSLAEGYNNLGDFQGEIKDMLETKSAKGRPAVLLVGYISQFDGRGAGNVVRIEFQP